ncbi:hypothetical protein P9112_008185 [Eukaryota sp. TZLM1-RC]
MADTSVAGKRGGFRGGFRGRRGGPRRRRDDTQEWTPMTKLGRLVKEGKIGSLEEIFRHSLPIKEYQIIDHFLPNLKDSVMKVATVQKQTRAGQRNRFKVFVIVGDFNGHVGLGVKCSKEVTTSIRSAIALAKLSIVPVRRGYWGSNIGSPHTVPCKVTGKCGSVRVRLVPAPRGSGIVAAHLPKKVLEFAGVEDVFTQSVGKTRTAGNFLKATFAACAQTYEYLTPNFWPESALTAPPAEEHSDFLLASKEGKK